MLNIKKILFILPILILIFTISIIFSLFNMSNSNIISGVSINNIDISKKSKEEAKSLLSNYISEKIKSELKLEYIADNKENYEKSIDLSILNINYDLDKTIGEAYLLGRKGNIFQNNFVIAKTLLFKKNLNLDISFDDEMLNTIISDISSNLPGKMIQNSYYIEDENLIITKGTSGIVVDKENFFKSIKEFIADFSSNKTVLKIPVKYAEAENIDLDKIHSEIYKEAKDAYFEKSPFKVYAEIKGVDFDLEKAKNLIKENPDSLEYTIGLKYTIPKTTVKNLDINIFPDKLGSFSTRYDVTNEDRSTNLEIAAAKIDGTILSPGEEFSYNKIVGERSIAAGYKEAKVYQGGEIVDGLGGGICQVSSTLYNAVVFANLKVTQRFNHQFTTSYVAAGRDATVAYGVKDFKFINNRTYPIKINISINSGVAKVDIYGINEEIEYQVDFDVETVSTIPYETKEEIDSSLPAGTERVKQRGANGVIVNVYKIIKQKGITLTKEFISKDKYNALDRIIIKSAE